VGHGGVEDNWRAGADITKSKFNSYEGKGHAFIEIILCIVKYLGQEPGRLA